jgi:hypothetical protein
MTRIQAQLEPGGSKLAGNLAGVGAATRSERYHGPFSVRFRQLAAASGVVKARKE